MEIATGALSEYLRLMQAHLPLALIDEAQWEKILAIGNIIPSAVTTFFGFECRLGVPDAKADFLFCSDATEAGRRVLAANAYGIDLPQELLRHRVWQNLRQFSTNWESEASALYTQVRNVWLEFDTASSPLEAVPVPSCFFGPEPLFSTPALQLQHPYSFVWDVALPLLLGRQVSQPLKQTLMQCLEYLPENAYVFQMGLMLARDCDAVRLCIRDISPDAVIEYLQRLNWNGDTKGLQNLLSDVTTMTDRIDLDIDIGDRIYPKIGLECYLFRQPKFDDRWTTFLNYLVLQGHCLLQKHQALCEFPGYIRQRMEPRLWPSDIRKLGGLLGPKYEWVIFKGLHHIKLVYQESQVKEAKAYLYTSRSLVSSVVKEPGQEK